MALRKSIKRVLFISALLSVAITNARAQSFEGCRTISNPPFEGVSLDVEVQAVFDRACVDCHNPASTDYSQHGLDLRRGFSHRALVNVNSRIDSSFPLANPFRPDGDVGSLLWWKVSCQPPPVGQTMPPPPSRLLSEELRAIYTWILRGAPVTDVRESARLVPNASLSGIWFDPSVSGQGFSLDVTAEDDPRAFLFWTTFGIGQDASPGPDARWIVGIGASDAENVIQFEFFQTAGGVFDSASSSATTFSIGTGSLSFGSRNEATLSYQVNLDGDSEKQFSRTIALRRLVVRGSCKVSVNPAPFFPPPRA